MTNDLINCYSNNKKLMPFVHLPIQSGSDKILKLMNRKHTVEYYLDIYKKLKKINPEIKFSSDFIIGYPGETETDFQDTMSLLDKIDFINSFSLNWHSYLHVAISGFHIYRVISMIVHTNILIYLPTQLFLDA